MNDSIKASLATLEVLFEQVDNELNDYKDEKCLEVPTLIGVLATKYGWNEKEVKENDHLVRFYIRRHPDWVITRGAHGGITRRSNIQAKIQAKANKEAAKKLIKDAIDAKVVDNAT
jgi:hypothetical protein